MAGKQPQRHYSSYEQGEHPCDPIREGNTPAILCGRGTHWVVAIGMFIMLMMPPVSAQVRHIVGCRTDLLVESEKVVSSEMGKAEVNNDAPHVARYNASVGAGRRSPYCASGQYYGFYRACERLGLHPSEIPIPRTALAYNVFLYGMENGKRTKYAASKHDMIVWKVPGKINGHIERVRTVLAGGWVETYAFNTTRNAGDPREGDCNAIRRRNIYSPLHRMQILGILGFYSSDDLKSSDDKRGGR